MKINPLGQLTLALAAATLISGCAAPSACETRTDYQKVSATNSIMIPDELDPLPGETKLEIPVASTPPDVDTSCLEKPPRFSETTPEDGSRTN
ncbi:MAG: hypothetical protein AAF270_02750 [Pseudomonadota bacterium]